MLALSLALLAASRLPSFASRPPSTALPVAFLETQFRSCATNRLQSRACEAALGYLSETLGARKPQTAASDPSVRFSELKRELRRHGRAETDWSTGALNAWIATLDSHAKLVRVKEKEDEHQRDRIEVAGAGAKLRFLSDRVLVAYVIEGSGAEAAGLRSGDEIFALAGRSLRNIGDHERRALFRAARSPYRLTVLREGRRFPLDIVEKRFSLANVESSTRLEEGNVVGVLKVRSFDHDLTCRDIRRALADAVGAGATSLELDLRNNPGGLVEQARCVAGIFLGSGQPFAKLQKFENARLRGLVPATKVGRLNPGSVELTTEGAQMTTLPLRVRINQNTASAAEMVAAALQDAKRATLLGSRSFGKGSMQSAFHPWDDESLYLMRTTHLIVRPSGKLIQYAGVNPDLVLEKAEGKNFPREQNLRTTDALN